MTTTVAFSVHEDNNIAVTLWYSAEFYREHDNGQDYTWRLQSAICQRIEVEAGSLEQVDVGKDYTAWLHRWIDEHSQHRSRHAGNPVVNDEHGHAIDLYRLLDEQYEADREAERSEVAMRDMYASPVFGLGL